MFFIRQFTHIFILLLLISSAWGKTELKQQSFRNAELVTLQHAKLIGSVNPQQVITFTVWLKLRNKDQLDHFVNELYNPRSASYHKFLTKKEYDANYAPSEQAVQAVENYFISQGMEAKRVYTMIRVTAKASQIEKVLGIKLNNYLYEDKQVYGNDSEPKINADIAQYIAGISDLSNIPSGHPRIHTPLSNKQKPPGLGAQPTQTSLSGFTGQQIQMAYNLSSVAPINGTPVNGAGQTIVLIDGCGSEDMTQIMSDANAYNNNNTPPLTLLTASNFAVVDYQGNPYVQGSLVCEAVWDGEIALDVQASHTMAPGANIVLVMTENINNTQVGTAIETIYNNNFSIGNFNNAYVVSNSWGNNSQGDLQTEALDSTLETGAGMGLSINFATGDCGDWTYTSAWPCSPIIGSNTPTIVYPASSAYVTAVGGTTLFVDNNYNYAFELGWGKYKNGAPSSGSTGGVSQWRQQPPWQSPISTFIAGGYGTVGTTNRAIPDIAMNADADTPLITYYDGSWSNGDGTSEATPLFSGILTLVNQARTLLNGGTPNPIGLAASYFYNYHMQLAASNALHLISPPHLVFSWMTPVNNAPVGSTPPLSAFNMIVNGDNVTFNWDVVLSIVENQWWNDVVGVGSPNVPGFVSEMVGL